MTIKPVVIFIDTGKNPLEAYINALENQIEFQKKCTSETSNILGQLIIGRDFILPDSANITLEEWILFHKVETIVLERIQTGGFLYADFEPNILDMCSTINEEDPDDTDKWLASVGLAREDIMNAFHRIFDPWKAEVQKRFSNIRTKEGIEIEISRN